MRARSAVSHLHADNLIKLDQQNRAYMDPVLLLLQTTSKYVDLTSGAMRKLHFDQYAFRGRSMEKARRRSRGGSECA
eukprot:scaffold55783_cov36-Tisochrysis_lutea.AAC.1